MVTAGLLPGRSQRQRVRGINENRGLGGRLGLVVEGGVVEVHFSPFVQDKGKRERGETRRKHKHKGNPGIKRNKRRTKLSMCWGGGEKEQKERILVSEVVTGERRNYLDEATLCEPISNAHGGGGKGVGLKERITWTGGRQPLARVPGFGSRGGKGIF